MRVNEMKVGDLFPRPRLRLQADGVGVDLSEAVSVVARVRLPGSAESVDREIIVADQSVPANYGVVTLVLLAGDTDYRGTITFDIEVEWATGVQTWPSKGYFKIWLLEDADSAQGGPVPSASQNDSLTFGRIYDVSITDPQDGQFISYDEDLGRWVNVDALLASLPRAPQWFLSGVAGHADPADIDSPVTGDTFLYPASGDLFYYDGDSWDYSATIGGA